MQNEGQIRVFSRLLRAACYMGMIGLMLLPIIHWMYNEEWVHEMAIPNWYIDFSGFHFEQIIDAIPFVKLIWLCAELANNALLLAVLALMSKLLISFEQAKFFTQQNGIYLKWIAFFLLLTQLVQPLYLLLQGHLWAVPGQKIIIPFDHLIGLKTLFLCGVIYLCSLIVRQMAVMEDEYKLTI